VGASSASAANLVLDGGALNFNGVAASTDRLLTLGAAGGVIDVSSAVASDTLTFASTGAIAYAGTGPRTLVLKGGTTGSSVFNPLIGDAGSDAVSVAKGGPGTWTLGSANTYTGGTTVTFGTLLLGDAAALGTGAVTITGGVLDLTGKSPTNNFFVDGGRLTGGTLPAAKVTAQAGTIDINLTGAGGLVKNGAEALILSGSNIFTGATFLNGGNLVLASKLALPGGSDWVGGTSNVTLAAGKLGLGFGDFARSLGTAADQTQFSGSAGFYALNADRVVNLGSAGIVLNWGSGGFVPTGSSLLLSDVTATHNVTFANPINFGAAQRAVDVVNGGAVVDATLSGALTGTGGLTKTGNGVLALTGVNLYSGQTRVEGGVVRLATAAALPGGTGATGGLDNLNFAGGAVELAAGDFARAVGTDAGEVQFTGTGGFAAVGADRTVNLGGAAASLTWGADGFLTDAAALILATPTATGTLTFANPIALGGTAVTVRSLQVEDGAAVVDAVMTGALSGLGGISKTGLGTLRLSGANTFTGDILMQPFSGRLILDGSNTYANAAIHAGSTLQLVGKPTPAGSTTGLINLYGGSLDLLFDGALGGAYGAAGLGTGLPSTVDFATPVTVTGRGSINVGSVTDRAYAGTPLYASSQNKLARISSLNLTDLTEVFVNNNSVYGLEVTGPSNLGPYPYLNVVNASTVFQPFGLIFSGKVSNTAFGFGIQKNGNGTMLLTNAANDFTGTVNINTGVLAVSNDGALGAAANVINIQGGHFLATETFTSTRNFRTLNAGSEIRVMPGKTLTLSGQLTNATSQAIAKGDMGRLVLSGANTFTTAFNVNQGAVRLANNFALGATAGGVTVANNYGAVLEINPGLSLPGPVTRATTAASATNSPNIPMNNTAGLVVGMSVTGTNIPANSFITAITANTTVTINQNIGGTAVANATSLSFLAEGITINSSGVNYGGALLGLAGSASSIGGALTIGTAGAVIGAESGATLNLNGGMAAGTNLGWVTNPRGTGVINFGTAAIASTGGFTQYGTGTVNFNFANTAMTGAMDIRAGNTFVNQVAFGGTGAITLRSGGKLTVVKGADTPNLMGSTRPLTLSGGELVLDATAATTAGPETFAGLTISGRGANVITVIPSATVGGTVVLGSMGGRSANGTTILFRSAGMSNTGPSAAANVGAVRSTGWLTGVGTGTDSTYNKVVLPFAFIGNSATSDAVSFATYTSATSNIRSLQSDEFLGTLFKDQNIRLTTASSNLGASFKVNSLQLNSGSSLFLAPNSVLTIGGAAGLGGGILATANTVINNGLITAGAASDVLLYVTSGNTLTMNSVIAGAGGGSNIAFNTHALGLQPGQQLPLDERGYARPERHGPDDRRHLPGQPADRLHPGHHLDRRQLHPRHQRPR